MEVVLPDLQQVGNKAGNAKQPSAVRGLHPSGHRDSAVRPPGDRGGASRAELFPGVSGGVGAAPALPRVLQEDSVAGAAQQREHVELARRIERRFSKDNIFANRPLMNELFNAYSQVNDAIARVVMQMFPFPGRFI